MALEKNWLNVGLKWGLIQSYEYFNELLGILL